MNNLQHVLVVSLLGLLGACGKSTSGGDQNPGSTTSAAMSSMQSSEGSHSSSADSSALSSSSVTDLSSSLSSSSAASSSSAMFDGDITQGKAEFEARCNFCHVDEANGQFAKGVFPFNVNSFTYPGMAKYQGYSADTPGALARFIDLNMPSSSSCNGECARDVAAYLWSLREDAQLTQSTIKGVTLDERGLTVELACAKDAGELNLMVEGSGLPDVSVNPQELTGVRAIAGVVEEVPVTDIAHYDGNRVVLTGAGEDIWLDQISFNGLRRTLDGPLDMTLRLDSVENATHPFAKVGLLLSNSGGLNGELLLVHWSAQHGLAEDSGLAELSEYNQLLENPNGEGQLTPVPAALRVAMAGDELHVGGCYGCAQPELQVAAFADFQPSTVFVIASSHNADAVTTTVELINNLKSNQAGQNGQLQVQASCGLLTRSIHVPAEQLADVQQLSVSLYQGDQLLSQQHVSRTFSTEASCAAQNELLMPQLRRLSQLQIRNSLTDIFGDIFLESVWPDLEDGAKLIGMNTTADRLNVNSLNFERLYDASRLIVARILDHSADLQSCIASSSDDCVGPTVRELGLKLWRRPMSESEFDSLAAQFSLFADNRQTLEYSLNALLLSSNFLFRSELGVEQNGERVLTNYEIVSLLSYSIWNSTPDEVLLELAAGAPLSSAQILNQVERMLQDPRATSALTEIYKDFLKLDLVLTREKAEAFHFDIDVRRGLLTSAERFLSERIVAGADFMQVFLGSDYFINEAIAPFFNLSTSGQALHSASADPNQRDGILNHPAFLGVHSTLAQSGIVKRGVFTLEQLLCQELPDPPGDVSTLPTPEEVNPEQTSERELLQITHSTQPGCMGCHQFIDPAGFGFENFDAVGRYRTEEKDGVPIDASGVLDGVGASVITYQNSAEYSRALAGSAQMQNCVAQRFLEHYLSQSLHHDSCELEKYQTYLSSAGNNSVQGLLRALVRLESFTRRRAGQ